MNELNSAIDSAADVAGRSEGAEEKLLAIIHLETLREIQLLRLCEGIGLETFEKIIRRVKQKTNEVIHATN